MGAGSKAGAACELFILSCILKRELIAMGYTPAAILDGWRQRGCLEVEGGKVKRQTKKRSLGGARTRMVVIKASAVDEVEG